jgi:hypothetical protein
LEALEIENVCTFMTIWYFLLSFGVLSPEKIWQPRSGGIAQYHATCRAVQVTLVSLVVIAAVLGVGLEEVDVLLVVGREDLGAVVAVHGARDVHESGVTAGLGLIL